MGSSSTFNFSHLQRVCLTPQDWASFPCLHCTCFRDTSAYYPQVAHFFGRFRVDALPTPSHDSAFYESPLHQSETPLGLATQVASCSPFERMDQGDAHIGALSVEPNKHLVTRAFQTRDSQHPFSTAPCRDDVRVVFGDRTQPFAHCEQQLQSCWTRPLRTSSRKTVPGTRRYHELPWTVPRFKLHSEHRTSSRSAPLSSNPSVRERRPRHWFSWR